MLHKTTHMIGSHLTARDGDIGHVDDVLFDEETWAARFLVVDTSNWIGGRRVLIATAAVTGFDPVEKRISVAVTREEVKQAPSIEEANLPLVETLPAVWIM
jgi:hypothetical protein